MPDDYPTIKAVLGEPYSSQFWAHVQKTETCWLWGYLPGDCRNLYRAPKGIFSFQSVPGIGKKYVTLIARRLAYQMFHGPLPSRRKLLPCPESLACINPFHCIVKPAATAEDATAKAAALAWFWQHVDKISQAPCWIWTGNTKLAQGNVRYGMLHIRGRKTHLRANRFSYEIHYGAPPPELFVCHNCPGGDNSLCVNPEHLWLGTSKQNQEDMARKGRSARGEKSPISKLRNEDIPFIRANYPRMSMGKLAKRFGVSHSTIYQVIHRESWRHIP